MIKINKPWRNLDINWRSDDIRKCLKIFLVWWHYCNHVMNCPYVKEKKNLLCVSFTSHLTLITRYEGFAHTKQFCNTSWASYNVTQFWHYLSENRVGSHRLRAQPHKAASSTPPHPPRPSSDVNQVLVVSYASDWLLIIGYHNSLFTFD